MSNLVSNGLSSLLFHGEIKAKFDKDLLIPVSETEDLLDAVDSMYIIDVIASKFSHLTEHRVFRDSFSSIAKH